MPFVLRPYRRIQVVSPVTYEHWWRAGEGIVWNLSLLGGDSLGSSVRAWWHLLHDSHESGESVIQPSRTSSVTLFLLTAVSSRSPK